MFIIELAIDAVISAMMKDLPDIYDGYD